MPQLCPASVIVMKESVGAVEGAGPYRVCCVLVPIVGDGGRDLKRPYGLGRNYPPL